MPVARKVWQPIAVAIPASAARRRTMYQTSAGIAPSPSLPVLPIAARKSGALRSSVRPAAWRYASRYVRACDGRHLVDFAVFLTQPQPPPFLLRIVVLELEANDSADASEGVGHDGEEGPIPQTDDGGGPHGLKQRAGLLGGEHRSRSFVDGVTRPADGVRGVGRQGLDDDTSRTACGDRRDAASPWARRRCPAAPQCRRRRGPAARSRAAECRAPRTSGGRRRPPAYRPPACFCSGY